ncbi:MAG: N-acetylmuramoyl-L-alanine amidase [Acidimicrobiia bacterium]
MFALTRRQFLGAATGLAVVGSGLALPARGLSINPRSSWGADLEPKGPLGVEDVRFLIVHHSASHNGHTGADVPGILRGWFDFHTGSRGWNDIAYNFVIDSEGGIWEARQGSLDGPVAGDATGGNQGFTQLVCLIGDTNTAAPTAAARSSLVRMLAWLADRYHVSTSPGAEVTFTSRGSNKWPEGTSVTTPTIAGHRDMSQTSCPGANLYSYVVGSLTADVETARGGSPPPPTTTSSSTSSTTSTSTTTIPPTTTTIPPSTTTTTTSSSTTTVPSTTTTAPDSTTTLASPSTSSPLAVEPLAADSGAPTGILATAGALVATGAGLLLWRHRRMGGN